MIRVKNWSEFQHYKDRSPPWIKLSTSLFQDYDFSSLSDASKLLAICIWTLASRYKDPQAGLVHDDINWIKNQCGLGDMVTEKNLKELENKGFISRASTMLAECKQNAIPETETETEEEKEKNYKKKKIDVPKPENVSDETWQDFLKHRKAKKAPVTQTAINRIASEAVKAGWTLEQALQETIMRGWQGFKAEWINNNQQGNNHGKQELTPLEICLAVAAEYDEQERANLNAGQPKLQYIQ